MTTEKIIEWKQYDMYLVSPMGRVVDRRNGRDVFVGNDGIVCIWVSWLREGICIDVANLVYELFIGEIGSGKMVSVVKVDKNKYLYNVDNLQLIDDVIENVRLERARRVARCEMWVWPGTDGLYAVGADKRLWSLMSVRVQHVVRSLGKYRLKINGGRRVLAVELVEAEANRRSVAQGMNGGIKDGQIEVWDEIVGLAEGGLFDNDFAQIAYSGYGDYENNIIDQYGSNDNLMGASGGEKRKAEEASAGERCVRIKLC